MEIAKLFRSNFRIRTLYINTHLRIAIGWCHFLLWKVYLNYDNERKTVNNMNLRNIVEWYRCNKKNCFLFITVSIVFVLTTGQIKNTTTGTRYYLITSLPFNRKIFFSNRRPKFVEQCFIQQNINVWLAGTNRSPVTYRTENV